MLIRTYVPTENSRVLIDWTANILTIILEVFGISIFLDWLIESSRKQRSEPRRQIALRRLFTALGRDLYISLARNNKTGEPMSERDDIRLHAEGVVTPSTNLQLDKYILHIAAATQSAIREIESLIDRFGDLFGIEFVNDLFQLGEIGYYIVQDGLFVKHHIIPNYEEDKRIEIAETIDRTFNPLRQRLMEACTLFIVERIYPLSSPNLRDKIEFYLLNFIVAYYPNLCDRILQGKRMKVTLNPGTP